MGPNICEAVHAFFQTGHLLKEVNQIFITLIPKEDRPEELGKFRPISLCNSTYKIISKCMVNRINIVMPNLVDDYQNAFFPGSIMVDNCYMAPELNAHVRKNIKGKHSAAILKVDLSKAYDRVRWDFIQATLSAMKFPEVWISRIMECISMVNYSVLVNGEPSCSFRPKVGLRQGDPLSPYIFILCMEVFSKKMSLLQYKRKLTGLRVAKRASSISHLFFADYALFYFKARVASCKTMRKCIDSFCDFAREMINFDKSTIIFSPNTSLEVADNLSSLLGVKTDSALGLYLGCLMDIDGRTTTGLRSIHDKILSKLSSWKFLHLNQTGKIILINGILAALSANVMAMYLIPEGISEKITSTIMSF